MRNLERLEKRIVLAGGAFLVVLAMNFGVDQSSRHVYADNSTPSPTPTRSATPTPDALATRIPAEQTVVAGLQLQLANLETLNKLAEQRTELERQIQERINVLNGIPIPTPTFTPDQIRIKQQAGLLPTYTPTPRPTFAPIPDVGAENKGNEGGDPWRNILVVGGILAAGALAVRVFRRKIAEGVRGIRNRSGRTPPPIGTGRP